nr:ankyrin repeat domain-containing protein [Marinicella sp. W31]MDC2878477.1 ankyrin repeat domain-containing protein [Marinicella sp. W31]
MTRRRFLIKFVVLACVIFAGLWGYGRILDMNAEPTYTADRLFKPYGEDVYHLAQRIERGGHISTRDVEALPGGVNKRYGEEITFLFLALQAHNLQAIDTLLAAGADPYMVDRPSQGSERNFVYYLTMRGPITGPVHGYDFENRMIQSYLKHGGKANVQLLGNGGEWLIEQVALSENYEGVKILLRAGADPWAEDGGGDTAMSIVASEAKKIIRNAEFPNRSGLFR